MDRESRRPHADAGRLAAKEEPDAGQQAAPPAERIRCVAIYAATIFLSSCLLFQIQPIIGKMILPWFGGTAAVWTTCMLFFQGVLLLGYLYSHWAVRHLRPQRQAVLHITLLVVSLVWLPVAPGAWWKPAGGEEPSFRILALLGTTVGLPYLVLSSTGPLIQSWYGRAAGVAFPYRLFALSNLGSLLGLILYPVLVEPWLSTGQQARYWSAGYGLFALLCAGAAFLSRSGKPLPQNAAGATLSPDWLRRCSWIVLAACPSALMLAVTNHLTQNVAPVPFLWILPLSIYLLTFILCFERDGWYRRGIFLALLVPALAGMSFLAVHGAELSLKLIVAGYSSGLFVACMFCHGELARRRPSLEHLTTFYLMVAAGGALGGLSVGLIAPYLFRGYFELPLTVAACSLLAMMIAYAELPRASVALAAGSILVLGLTVITIRSFSQGARLASRNFYGAVRIRDSDFQKGADSIRMLWHGSIIHGAQFRSAERRRQPTTYYGPQSGAAIAIRAIRRPARIGVVGLGAGTLAAYGRPADYYRFYEINPLIIRLATSEFNYLSDCPARVDLVLGDARLSLEREPPQGFDVLAVDAFSGDSIPVHLLTREAFALFFRHLHAGGVVAIHISNRYVDLSSVVQLLADSIGAEALAVENTADSARQVSISRWVLVTKNRELLESAELKASGKPVRKRQGLHPWTDDYSNLLQVLN